MKEYKDAWRNYANFHGRVGLRGFWMAQLVHYLIAFLWGLLILLFSLFPTMDAARNPEKYYRSTPPGFDGIMILILLTGVFYLASFIPMLSLLVRRLHDSNKRGAFVLLSLLPGVGAVVLIFFLCQPSDPGRNLYGDPASESAAVKAPIRPSGPRAEAGPHTPPSPEPKRIQQPARQPEYPNHSDHSHVVIQNSPLNGNSKTATIVQNAERISIPTSNAVPNHLFRVKMQDMNRSGKIYECGFERNMLLGRSASIQSHQGISLAHETTVSGEHCMIATDGQTFYCKDLDSKNGTRINGHRICDITPIKNGDTLALGDASYKIYFM